MNPEICPNVSVERLSCIRALDGIPPKRLNWRIGLTTQLKIPNAITPVHKSKAAPPLIRLCEIGSILPDFCKNFEFRSHVLKRVRIFAEGGAWFGAAPGSPSEGPPGNSHVKSRTDDSHIRGTVFRYIETVMSKKTLQRNDRATPMAKLLIIMTCRTTLAVK